jgi:hypothetical protein
VSSNCSNRSLRPDFQQPAIGIAVDTSNLSKDEGFYLESCANEHKSAERVNYPVGRPSKCYKGA